MKENKSKWTKEQKNFRRNRENSEKHKKIEVIRRIVQEISTNTKISREKCELLVKNANSIKQTKVRENHHTFSASSSSRWYKLNGWKTANELKWKKIRCSRYFHLPAQIFTLQIEQSFFFIRPLIKCVRPCACVDEFYIYFVQEKNWFEQENISVFFFQCETQSSWLEFRKQYSQCEAFSMEKQSCEN